MAYQMLKCLQDKFLSQFQTHITKGLPSLVNKLDAEFTSMEDWFLNIHTNVTEKVIIILPSS